MPETQTLLGLLRSDLAEGEEVKTTSIYFHSPRPGVSSPGFNTLQRDSNFTWVSQARLGRDVAMQFVGGGEETITLDGRLYPRFFGGLGMLERIRAAGEAGHRFVLTTYNIENTSSGTTASFAYSATPVGLFGVRRLKEGQVRIGGDGLPSVVEFTLELVKLGEDAGDGTTGEFLFSSRQQPDSGKPAPNVGSERV